MEWTESTAVAAAQAAANAWPDRHPRAPGEPGNCIEATRHLIAALKPVGLTITPLPCEMIVGNAAALPYVSDGIPAADWPPSAWALGVGVEQSKSQATGWNGHLIGVSDWFVADLSLGTLSRPNRGLHLRPVVIPRSNLMTDNGKHLATYDDWFVVYNERPELAAWRRAPAWRGDPNQRVVNNMTAAAHAALETHQR